MVTGPLSASAARNRPPAQDLCAPTVESLERGIAFIDERVRDNPGERVLMSPYNGYCVVVPRPDPYRTCHLYRRARAHPLQERPRPRGDDGARLGC
jgi:hypothetical protein